MLAALSKNLSSNLGNKLHSSSEQIQIYAYGLEILLGILIKVSVIIGLSLCLNIFDTTMIFLINFAVFRSIGGGVHLSTYSKCLVFGVILILSLSSLANINMGFNNLVILLIGTLFLGVLVVIKWVPAGTVKKTDYRTRGKISTKEKDVYGIIYLACYNYSVYTKRFIGICSG